jgi:hypothetical protein
VRTGINGSAPCVGCADRRCVRPAAAAGPPAQPCAVHPHPGDAPAQLARTAGPPGRTGLLWRLVTSFPDDVNAKMAMEQLGGSLAGAGRLAEAERALRETLRMCAQSPAGRSGTSGVAALRLAEVILAGGDAGRAGGAAGLLEAVRPQVEEQRLFGDVVFRFLLASARAAGLRRDLAAPAVSPTR